MTDATEAARRLLKAVDAPASMMGGETIIVSPTDVAVVARALLAGNDEVARLREALRTVENCGAGGCCTCLETVTEALEPGNG